MKSPKPKSRPTRLPRWQEWSVYATLGALIVTGLLWLGLDEFVRIEGEFGPEHHPGQALSLMLHGIAGYAFLVIGGAMIPVHIKLGWHLRRNRRSGLILSLTCLFLALSAVALYYAGAEGFRSMASLAHWLVGILLVPALLFHVIRGLRGA
ncbi:hypothetical protein [Sphingomicrobium nitratireducens]|uniref:hypothetical protein n=1 Tax=Sphingomicrobium nitratireducens TaxID=2964666 RepID=UPI00223F93D8|nr:hypothetical protein [Sphingomicrobium nitratireducens]